MGNEPVSVWKRTDSRSVSALSTRIRGLELVYAALSVGRVLGRRVLIELRPINRNPRRLPAAPELLMKQGVSTLLSSRRSSDMASNRRLLFYSSSCGGMVSSVP